MPIRVIWNDGTSTVFPLIEIWTPNDVGLGSITFKSGGANVRIRWESVRCVIEELEIDDAKS